MADQFIFEETAYEKLRNKKIKKYNLTKKKLDKITSDFSSIISKHTWHQNEKSRLVKQLRTRLEKQNIFNQLPIELKWRITFWSNLYNYRA
jgi:hypothetical protein